MNSETLDGAGETAQHLRAVGSIPRTHAVTHDHL